MIYQTGYHSIARIQPLDHLHHKWPVPQHILIDFPLFPSGEKDIPGLTDSTVPRRPWDPRGLAGSVSSSTCPKRMMSGSMWSGDPSLKKVRLLMLSISHENELYYLEY